MNFQLTYDVSSGMMEAPHRLAISSAGEAHYERCSNLTIDPEQPEIGLYESTLTAQELGQLGQLAGPATLRNVSDHSGRVQSGAFHRRIVIESGSEKVEKIVGGKAPVDRRLENAIRYLDQLVARVRRHPVQVVRMEVAAVRSSGGSGITADLQFLNIGGEASRIQDPRSMVGPAGAGLEIWLWPQGGDRIVMNSSLRIDSVKGGTPAAISERGPSDQGQPRILPAILMEPRQVVACTLRAELPRECRGTCTLRVSYLNAAAGAAPSTLLRGQLLSAAIRV